MAKVSKAIEAAIRKFAAAEYPNEACGVITQRGKKLVAVQCANISDTPQARFAIAGSEYRNLIDTTGVYGVWHSHVDEPSTPSPDDVASCNATGVDWFIVDIWRRDEKGFEFGEIAHLAPEDEDTDYLGRTYIYGVRDCFTLARDYYKNEFKIDIDYRAPGYPEITNWGALVGNMLLDSYQAAGFVELIDEEHQIGDLLLIQMGVATDHIAIYLGDDRIMHHCSGRLSTTDVYGGGYWQKHTTAHIRHSSLIGK